MSRIKRINTLIKQLDKKTEKSNNYSIESMREHIEEIRSLISKGDKHWAAETLDVLIHCLLLLDRNNFQVEEINELFNIRCKRFEEKILRQARTRQVN